jgi:hypothetical protein
MIALNTSVVAMSSACSGLAAASTLLRATAVACSKSSTMDITAASLVAKQRAKSDGAKSAAAAI